MKKKFIMILLLLITFNTTVFAKSKVNVTIQGIPVNYKIDYYSSKQMQTDAFDKDWQKLLFFTGVSLVIIGVSL